MTDLKYDPELPFVVRIRFSENVLGRFNVLEDATDSTLGLWAAYDVEVIDTTPKPKIPEDADFVRWDAPSGKYDYYARKMSGGAWRLDRGTVLSLTELIHTIGDSEVTVLVRKEES